jgi:hypothetical protein
MREIVSPLSGFRSPFGSNLGSSDPIPSLSLPFATSGTLDSRITFSRTSHATMFDSTGKLTFAPNNLFLNSATLSTQNVTTAPINYIISFKGTGTITLTGTSTAGPIVGTGATDRVFLKITPTAGTLTCTVSGSVTEAQLERVTYETTPRTYNPTTAAAYYGPRFDFNPSTLAARGLLIEEARTNVVLHSRDLANAAWTKTNCTAALTQTGIDGAANTASLLTATAANATCTQAITLASSARAHSAYVRRVTGTGTVEMTMDGGTTWTAITLTSTFARFAIPTQTIANPNVGFRIVTSGDAIEVDCVQNENGTFATSYIPTTTASVTRAADSAIMTGTNFSSWYNQSEGTFVYNAAQSATSGTESMAGFTYIDGSGVSATLHFINNSAASVQLTSYNTAGVLQADLKNNSPAIVQGVSRKTAYAYALDNFGVTTGGGAVNTDTSCSLPAPTIYSIGSLRGNQSFLNGHIKSITYYNMRLPNATLQSLTA